MFNSLISPAITLSSFLACMATAIVLGVLTALVFSFRSRHSSSFTLALALLPAAVTMVIIMVNGNIGAGLAVAGTFALVRFRRERQGRSSGCSSRCRLALSAAWAIYMLPCCIS